MQLKFGFISVDDHVQETPDLWTSRVAKKFADRVPQLVTAKDGSQQWFVDGQMLLEGRTARAGALMADRNEDPKRWADVPAPAYMPTERLKAMDSAGIDYSVLYPTVAGLAGDTFGRLQDSELEIACVRAYNDWLIDEWAGASDRFIPQCLVPIWPIDAAVAEIKRAVGRGHRGVILPSLPMHLREVPHISGPEYDPLWSVCEELGVPVCLHAGAFAGITVALAAKYETGAGRGSGCCDQTGVECVRDFALLFFARLAAPPEIALGSWPKARSVGACSIWNGPITSSNMTVSPARVTTSRRCKCSSANVSSTPGTIRSRRSPITSAPITFSGRPIYRSRIRPGRAPRKPSIIVSKAYRRKHANECCGKMRRSFIGCRSWIAKYQDSCRSVPWREVLKL